jgi:hypothetical protein
VDILNKEKELIEKKELIKKLEQTEKMIKSFLKLHEIYHYKERK